MKLKLTTDLTTDKNQMKTFSDRFIYMHLSLFNKSNFDINNQIFSFDLIHFLVAKAN